MKLKKTKNVEVDVEKVHQPVVKKIIKKEEAVEEPKKEYHDLRDAMDYTRMFNIFYSGVEQKSYFDILYDMGVRNFLMSYHYIQNKKFNTNDYKNMGVKFFIDSGAFTYQVDPQYSEVTIEEWEKHIVRYLNWAKKHRDMIFAIANLDLENLYGPDVIREWNEKYFEPFMLETGIPVCFIWHPIDTDKGWEKYCQRYPYVGMSWVSDEGVDLDFDYGRNMLLIAEKYNSVVHGMGMTRTSLLTKLPFYTSDSTTWLVGLQYGEINYWTGQKMTRLKKEKWKTTYLDLICNEFNLNKDVLLEEDITEMIKANVGAFIRAEEFIQHMAKSRYYWMKPDKKVRKSIDEVNFPPIEWLRGETDYVDWKYYAEELNITQELEENAIITLIIDTTLFTLKDIEPYSESFGNTYDENAIKEIHNEWVNRIVPSLEDMIDDLNIFFTEVVLGENTTLLYLGTNFDRIIKERDSYITDEEYDYLDLPEIEVNNAISKYLPALTEGDPAPEISDLDDEIFREEGIEPVRDEHGRFVKGQKKVLKPKKLYSKKYPKLACDRCANAQICPEYKAGFVCAYNKMFDRYNTRDVGDVVQAMQGIADLSMQRLQRAMISETMNGGLLDPNVTNAMNQTMGLFNQLQKMYEFGGQEVLKQTKIVRADGTEETTTSVSNPQSGGILEKMFSNLGKSKEEEPKEEETPQEEPTEVIVEAKEVESKEEN